VQRRSNARYGPRASTNQPTRRSDMGATLDGAPVPAASQSKCGPDAALSAVKGPGVRAYIAVRGEIDVPEYSEAAVPSSWDDLAAARPGWRSAAAETPRYPIHRKFPPL
jgi:hypothetical protein